MAFTESCAIRISNPSLWRRLTALGLHQNRLVAKLEERTLSNQMCIVAERGSYFCIRQENLLDYVYDCGTNIDLFLALAVMRDDTDIHQWFIYDDRDWNEDNPQRSWFKCEYDKLEKFLTNDQMYQDCEKATRMEIIAHFNGLDDDNDFIK